MGARVIPALGLMLLAVAAYADSGWTGYGDITEVTAEASGRFTVTLKADPNPSNCGDGQHFYSGGSAPGVDQMFHALTAALGAGKQVRLQLSGNCDMSGYAEFTAIGVTP